MKWGKVSTTLLVHLNGVKIVSLACFTLVLLNTAKDVIMGSLQDCHGTVRVVFASVAMGMGIDIHGVDTIIHYDAPSSIEELFPS